MANINIYIFDFANLSFHKEFYTFVRTYMPLILQILDTIIANDKQKSMCMVITSIIMLWHILLA